MEGIVTVIAIHRPDLDVPPPYPPAVPQEPIPETPHPPTILEMAANFTGAMARWTAAGFPVVSAEVAEQRLTACQACENWQPVMGLGRCKLCGCFGFKLWLATERCRHPSGSRWPENEFVKPAIKE